MSGNYSVNQPLIHPVCDSQGNTHPCVSELLNSLSANGGGADCSEFGIKKTLDLPNGVDSRPF